MIYTKETIPLFTGDIDVSAEGLVTASHDASIFEVKPEVVMHPKTVDDIRALVRYANEHGGTTITGRSAGTDMSGGPLNESIIVSFTRYFNHIKTVANGYAVTEPGVYYRDFDVATKEVDGQILPSYPASRELCTVGGMVANNSGGEKTLTYGKTDRYIRRVNMILADGNEYTFKPLTRAELEGKMKLTTFEGDIYRKMYALIDKNHNLIASAKPVVSKNSCGYYLWNVWNPSTDTFDLTQVIVGSQGTLGLITEIEFGLVKPKKHSRLLVIFLKDLQQLASTFYQHL